MIKHISELLKERENLKTVKSKRALILKEIVDNLIKERNENLYYTKNGKRIKLKPITPRQIAIRTSHFTTDQLFDLSVSCKHAKNYSATFWYLSKTINEQ